MSDTSIANFIGETRRKSQSQKFIKYSQLIPAILRVPSPLFHKISILYSFDQSIVFESLNCHENFFPSKENRKLRCRAKCIERSNANTFRIPLFRSRKSVCTVRFPVCLTQREKFAKSICGPLVNGENTRCPIILFESRLTLFILRVFTGWQRKRRHKGTLDTRVSTGEGRGWPD